MQFASWKERNLVAAALKSVYRAENAEVAARELEVFGQGPWGRKYPTIAQSWRRNWEAVIPFFAFAPEVRKIIHTTRSRIWRLRSARPCATRDAFRTTKRR